jgi:hypothetical protein
MCPGRRKSAGVVAGSMATWIVFHRSHRERRAVGLGVLVRHLGQAQLTTPLRRQREADESPAVLRHEVDGVGRHAFRRTHQVSLVLPVLVVRHDHEATLFYVCNCLFYRPE